MKILFLHPNFPSQFRHLATHLASDPINQVAYITEQPNGQIPGVKKFLYQTQRETSHQTHRYVRNLENAVSNGQAAWKTAYQIKTQLGFIPDVIYAHVGWGPGLFMRDLFPEARYVGFFEWYYHARGADADFDPNKPIDADDAARLHVKNAAILLELVRCDAGIVPTHWQKQQFPPEFHHKLHVLHDGIDVDLCHPNPDATLVLPPRPTHENAAIVAKTSANPFSKQKGNTKRKRTKGFSPNPRHGKQSLKTYSRPVIHSSPKTSHQTDARLWPIDGLDLSATREIITYVARGMEPYRGFPQFMEAVSLLQQRRSHCHAVIVGADRVAYGSSLADGRTYLQKAVEELPLDLDHIHFTGPLPHDQLRRVYQASSVHVYLTYPFVLSWSMLEAMSCGCVVLGSKTAPVEEVITDGVNGLLVDFWDVEAIATRLNDILDNQAALNQLRTNARQTIVERYNLSQLLPQQIELLQGTPQYDSNNWDQRSVPTHTKTLSRVA